MTSPATTPAAATFRTHTYTVAEGGKVAPRWVGTELTIHNPDPKAGVANALASGAYENEAALVAAANQMRNIAIREAFRDAMDGSAEGADKVTLDDVIAAGRAVVMKAPRDRVEGGARKESSGVVKAAKAAKSKLDDTLTRAALDPAYAKRVVAAELYTTEAIAAERTRIEALPEADRPTLEAVVARIKAAV
jgi:hypothetical protein